MCVELSVMFLLLFSFILPLAQVLQAWTCVDKIQQIEWGSDSALILCTMYKRPVVQAWSLNQAEWTCKIDEGDAGLIHACFTPDCQNIITTAEFMVGGR